MPQLDKVTFLSQFFWLCVFYLGLYYVLLKYYLPAIGRIIALRQEKIGIAGQGILDLQQESYQKRKSFHAACSRAFATSKTAFTDFFSKTNTWVTSHLKTLSKINYKNPNKSSLHSLTQESFDENMRFDHASTVSSDKLGFTQLVSRLGDSRTTRGTQRNESGGSKKSKKSKK